jgi:hypothetical protein
MSTGVASSSYNWHHSTINMSCTSLVVVLWEKVGLGQVAFWGWWGGGAAMHRHPTQQGKNHINTHAQAQLSLSITCVAWNIASHETVWFCYSAKSWHQGVDMHPPPTTNCAWCTHTTQWSFVNEAACAHSTHTDVQVRTQHMATQHLAHRGRHTCTWEPNPTFSK